MLKFVLVEESESRVLYKYYPEGCFEAGSVSFDKKSGNGTIETLADNDNHQIYAMKALQRIRRMADSQVFEQEGVVAWY